MCFKEGNITKHVTRKKEYDDPRCAADNIIQAIP